MKRVRFGIRVSIFGAFRNMGVLVFRLSDADAMRLVNLVTEMRLILRATGNGAEADKLICEVEDVR